MSERERFKEWLADKEYGGDDLDWLEQAWQARARIDQQEKAELFKALKELRDAEWMVTADWCGPGKRDELNDRIDAILASHEKQP